MKLPSKLAMFAATLAFGIAFAQTPAASKPQMAEQVSKNIQVLKGVPVDEFMGDDGPFLGRPHRVLR